MLRVFASFTLFSALSLFASPSFAAYPKPPDAAEKVEIKKAFDTWYAKTTPEFEKSWAGIQAAEAAAKPIYEKGVKLIKAGKNKDGIASLLAARAKLFSGSNGELMHVDKGLSLEIALALAEQYEELGDKARTKREIAFMDHGREWLSKKEEQKIFLNSAIRELYRVHSIEEGKTGGDRMKTKERNQLDRVLRYMVMGGHTDIIFEEGYNQRKSWQKAKDDAKKTFHKDDYEDYGSYEGVEDHSALHPASAFKKGETILVINKKITGVSGKKAILDFSAESTVPVNCKSTGKILEFSARGRAIYKQKCSFSKRKGGHKMTVSLPKGLKLKKGDLITMYAKVSKVDYVKRKRSEITVETPAVVHSSRKGKTQWLLGVKTSKPSFIEADGDYRVKIKDDAEAPPTVE